MNPKVMNAADTGLIGGDKMKFYTIKLPKFLVCMCVFFCCR
ncbi:stage V sporulation protein M, partial [Bacillus velezensis]